MIKKELMSEYQTILGQPPSKSNSYQIVSINGKCTLCKGKALKQYEKDFYIQCDQYRNKNIEGYFELHMRVYFKSQRPDLDNSLKIILDCLQSVKAIKNDNQCTRLIIDKFLDKENPRIEFKIVPILE